MMTRSVKFSQNGTSGETGRTGPGSPRVALKQVGIMCRRAPTGQWPRQGWQGLAGRGHCSRVGGPICGAGAAEQGKAGQKRQAGNVWPKLWRRMDIFQIKQLFL